MKKIQVLYGAMPCPLANKYRIFGGASCPRRTCLRSPKRLRRGQKSALQTRYFIPPPPQTHVIREITGTVITLSARVPRWSVLRIKLCKPKLCHSYSPLFVLMLSSYLRQNLQSFLFPSCFPI